VRIAFASDGQVDWDQIGEIDTVMVSDPEVRMTADLEARDRSFGLISHPGYRSYLAKQISDKVVETINTALVGSTP
jgi:hypothetical protein